MRKSFTGVTHDDDCDPCVMDDREPLPGSGLRFATLLEGLAIGVTSTMMAEPVDRAPEVSGADTSIHSITAEA
jgi:hypothetical protein